MLTKMTEHTLHTFERKIFRRIYGPIQENEQWHHRWKSKIYSLHKDLNIVHNIKIRRLGWVGHNIGMEDERIPQKNSNGKFSNTRSVRKSRTRWEDIVHRDALQVLGIRGWWRRAEDTRGGRHL
jgi:hypothetical protein